MPGGKKIEVLENHWGVEGGNRKLFSFYERNDRGTGGSRKEG